MKGRGLAIGALAAVCLAGGVAAGAGVSSVLGVSVSRSGSLGAAISAGTLGGPAAFAPAPQGGLTPTDVPVLLVPGWFDTGRDLAALRIRLTAAGWSHVTALTFEDPTGSNLDHATEIASAVARVLAETGSTEVDVVAHSMGGLAARWYLMTRAPAPVRRIVFLASPHRGTHSAHLAWGKGREEMLPGSAFLAALNAGAPLPDGVEAITIRTPIDTHVVPGESATLPGVPDRTVCCPTHQGLLRDDEVFRLVAEFLEGGPTALR